MLYSKKLILAFLLVIASAGFSGFEIFYYKGYIKFQTLEAARKNKKNSSKKNKESKNVSKNSSEKSTEDANDGLLSDNEKAKSYMPDIYRCPDCGYEQDEPGFCPDHVSLELIKIISNSNDPLAPAELDGNEDILVDIPLNIQFKKDDLELKQDDASTMKNQSNDNKKSSKEKKSKSKK